MDKDLYAFGSRLAARVDFYSFPRTGSHFLFTCLTGLVDLVFFPNQFAHEAEPRQRAEELNPHTFYMMKLREDGVPYQPVYVNPEPNGTHGQPTFGSWPVVAMIRDPHPTIYSYYHTAKDRWNLQATDRVAWIKEAYAGYRAFYDRIFEMQRVNPDNLLLIRFEELKKDPAVLAQFCAFVGVTPKLKPEFVHWATAFERMTKPGEKTFFRGGNNERWLEDKQWRRDVLDAAPGYFGSYGYLEDQLV